MFVRVCGVFDVCLCVFVTFVRVLCMFVRVCACFLRLSACQCMGVRVSACLCVCVRVLLYVFVPARFGAIYLHWSRRMFWPWMHMHGASLPRSLS